MDARTGLEFRLRADGFLAQAPTLRVFLLDQLSQVDRTAAATYAERILSGSDSSDEWALSLRNYAIGHNDEKGRVFLQQKFREMIQKDSWRRDPSLGFLEAFDVPVHIGGTELLPDLGSLLRDKDNKPVSRAAYLALDRLTINESAAVLGHLQQRLEIMEGREMTRANLFARADVSDLHQRTILENYLLDPRIGKQELDAFSGLYPNANYMVSANLLTLTTTPIGETLALRDQAALRTVQQWISESRFDHVRPWLEKVRQRLEVFTRQAGSAPPLEANGKP